VYVARMVLGEKCIQNLVQKILRGEAYWETISRWQKNFKMNLKDIYFEDVDSIHLV